MGLAKKILANDLAADYGLFVGLFTYAEQLCHFLVFEPFSGNVRLHPCAIDHELGNRPLARLSNHFSGRVRRFVNVDLMIGNIVLVEPALGDMAVAAPRSSIDS